MKMVTWTKGVAAVLWTAGALAACGGDGGGQSRCADVGCLHRALAEAGPGDMIELEAGTFEGSFTLPAGVTLHGAGPDQTVLRFAGDGPVLVAEVGETGASRVADLAVEGVAGGGVLAEGACAGGDGVLELEHLAVSVQAGLGIGVWNACALRATDVTVTGNVDEQNKSGIVPAPDDTLFAVAGLALVQVGDARLTRVELSGAAAYGAVLYETPTAWSGGEVHHLVGTGIQADGPVDVSLQDLAVHHVWQGATPYGYGIVASREVNLTTENVSLEDNEGLGLLINESSGDFSGLTVRSNNNRGVWVQFCNPPQAGEPSVRIHGTNTLFDANRGVALGVYVSTGVEVADATIQATEKFEVSNNGTGELIGDGIEIIESDQGTFRDLIVQDNERAGVVVDCGDLESSDIQFDNVQISGEGDRGFVPQNGTVTTSPEVTTEALRQADELGGNLDTATEIQLEDIPAPDEIIEVDI